MIFPDHQTPEAEPGSRTPAGLVEFVEQLQSNPQRDVRIFDFDGWRYVMKRVRPRRGAWLKAWGSALLCKVFFGEFPSPSLLMVGDIHHEAKRIEELAAHGQNVPKVYLQTSNCLVFEYCGLTAETILHHMEGDDRHALLERVVDDLADFHRAGCWHGGAQLRNLTMKEGKLYRIDFEENVGEAVSLGLAQAYDVFQAFSSILGKLGDHEVHTYGVVLLKRYLDRHRSPQVRAMLMRISRLLRIARGSQRWLGARWRANNDVRRTVRVGLALEEALAG